MPWECLQDRRHCVYYKSNVPNLDILGRGRKYFLCVQMVLRKKCSRVSAALSPKLPGMGSRLPATLYWMSGTEKGWMDDLDPSLLFSVF